MEALIRDARSIDEYAFALGALAHYANDNTGHPEATNKAGPLTFPYGLEMKDVFVDHDRAIATLSARWRRWRHPE